MNSAMVGMRADERKESQNQSYVSVFRSQEEQARDSPFFEHSTTSAKSTRAERPQCSGIMMRADGEMRSPALRRHSVQAAGCADSPLRANRMDTCGVLSARAPRSPLMRTKWGAAFGTVFFCFFFWTQKKKKREECLHERRMYSKVLSHASVQKISLHKAEK
jgi:hypothetical protein